ncbi:MAG TPA: hypothetical protein VGB52_08965 [Actinomycetota bacterium]
MHALRSLRILPVALAIAGVAAACGGSASASTCTDDGRTIPVPDQIAGLQVHPSEKARATLLKEREETQTYLCDVTVFELRDGAKADDELIAVLQVIRMTDDARVDDIDFLREIANGVGAGQSKTPPKIQGIFVWQTEQNQQFLNLWFQERFMQVLIVRQTTQLGDPVPAPAVLEEVLKLRPVDA